MKSIRVILADDHSLVRAGIRALLEHLDGIKIVGEAGNGSEALALIQGCRPDVVLMDIAMPGLSGLDALSRITRKFPKVRVLILSVYADEEYVLRSLRDGAAGYLVKNARTAELELAIRAAARGEVYISPAISKCVIEDYLQRTEVVGLLERLTPRQREILTLIAEGYRTKEIAQRLKISIKTVEMHRTQLMQRLNIHNVTGLVRYAIRVGLIRS